MMSGLDRTALLRNETLSEAEEARSRFRVLSRELAEFKEVHSATIDSLKTECDRIQAEVDEHKAAVKMARSEAKVDREDLEAYWSAEASRLDSFVHRKDLLQVIGLKAYRFLNIGFRGCPPVRTGGFAATRCRHGLPQHSKSRGLHSQ